MKYLQFIISFLLTAGIIAYLNGNIFGGGSLPPFGKLLNPFSGIWTNTESANTATNFSINGGVKDEVNIIIDEHGIPHIYAKNLSDALFAQGYMEGKERLF